MSNKSEMEQIMFASKVTKVKCDCKKKKHFVLSVHLIRQDGDDVLGWREFDSRSEAEDAGPQFLREVSDDFVKKVGIKPEITEEGYGDVTSMVDQHRKHLRESDPELN